MITLNSADAKHKAVMYRLLGALLDDSDISLNIVFKGRTCAAMSGFLDRFSVDLDFDLVNLEQKDNIRKKLHKLFPEIGLRVDKESKKALQFFLKYDAEPNRRNSLKLEITDIVFQAPKSEMRFLPDIKRSVRCQTKETMFAHKLVAMTDRYEKHKSIAGRDLYDIHHFLYSGFGYESSAIEERTNMSVLEYFQKLINFIQDKITQTIINEDLNHLVPKEKFKVIRKILKSETIFFLEEEIRRLQS